MYVDALWAYYRDGVQLLSDDQFQKLKEDFPCTYSFRGWGISFTLGIRVLECVLLWAIFGP